MNSKTSPVLLPSSEQSQVTVQHLRFPSPFCISTYTRVLGPEIAV